MKRELFGTDGIRGCSNRHPMTAEIALALGRAAGKRFLTGSPPHRVVIGKDTRLSGYMLEPALVAGFISAGMDVLLVGPMPTPAVAFLTRSLRADLGVMISASHNPFYDNGIKLFGPDGYKLSDSIEAQIEVEMASLPKDGVAAPGKLGRARRLDDARGRYIESLKSSFPKGQNLSGLKIVVDCANGAAYHIAPDILSELGAEVVALGTRPDGLNINAECGSTHPSKLADAVLRERADLGLALDGDADRLVLVDEKGQVIDGDQVLGLITSHWHAEGKLNGGGIAATLMSNLGLERFVSEMGLRFLRTKVGDRYVMERMIDEGLNVGGEQSGHIILNDFATTGDGTLAALQVLAVLRNSHRSFSEIARCFEPVPQQLRNLPITRKIDLETPAIVSAIASSDLELNGRGRLLVRPSGTEPIIRVMVEADDGVLLEKVMDRVTDAIAQQSESSSTSG